MESETNPARRDFEIQRLEGTRAVLEQAIENFCSLYGGGRIPPVVELADWHRDIEFLLRRALVGDLRIQAIALSRSTKWSDIQALARIVRELHQEHVRTDFDYVAEMDRLEVQADSSKWYPGF